MDESGGLLLEFGIILLLVLVNGVFSMAEMAVVSARKARLLQRAEGGDENSRAALRLADAPTRFLSTVQIGITLIGVLAGAFGGASLAEKLAVWIERIPVPFIQAQAEALAVFLIVLLISYLSLVLGELVPKRLALSNPEGIAAAMARPMSFVSRLASPLVGLLTLSTELILRLLRVKKSGDAPVTPEEITVMMEQGEQVGVFEETETDIVEAVFRLGDLRAGSLMTPRTEIDWLDVEDPLEENLRYLMDSPHTHLPVADSSLDDVLGVLRAKDLLARLQDNVAVDIRSIILPVEYVPESMPAFQVLEVLRSASGNLSLVIDEFGGTVGMVTLFDVMEAMVGGISERGEPVSPEAVQREDGSWLVEGMMRIDAFKDLFNIDVLPDEDRAGYQTLGGFVMAQIGAVPTTGEVFTCCGMRFEVMDMDGLRVDKVLVGKDE